MTGDGDTGPVATQCHRLEKSYEGSNKSPLSNFITDHDFFNASTLYNSGFLDYALGKNL